MNAVYTCLLRAIGTCDDRFVSLRYLIVCARLQALSIASLLLAPGLDPGVSR